MKRSTRESFKEYLKSQMFSYSTIDRRMTVLQMFWDWLDHENIEADQVSYNDVLAYMKYKSLNGATQKTILHYMNAVKHFYAHLIREGQITTNPVTDIKVKGVKRKILYHILETHELHQLYNQYPGSTRFETLKDRRNKVMLGLLIYQGLRTDELSKLEVNQINLREGKIDVPGGKRSNGREMKLESHQIMDMYDYVLQVRPEILKMKPKRKSQIRQKSEKLFIGDGGNCYSVSNFMTQLMIKVRKLNPSVLNAKQIRTSVITKWLKIYNLREVQYLAGHKYISSTEGYRENDMEGLKEEVQQYHPLG